MIVVRYRKYISKYAVLLLFGMYSLFGCVAVQLFDTPKLDSERLVHPVARFQSKSKSKILVIGGYYPSVRNRDECRSKMVDYLFNFPEISVLAEKPSIVLAEEYPLRTRGTTCIVPGDYIRDLKEIGVNPRDLPNVQETAEIPAERVYKFLHAILRAQGPSAFEDLIKIFKIDPMQKRATLRDIGVDYYLLIDITPVWKSISEENSIVTYAIFEKLLNPSFYLNMVSFGIFPQIEYRLKSGITAQIYDKDLNLVHSLSVKTNYWNITSIWPRVYSKDLDRSEDKGQVPNSVLDQETKLLMETLFINPIE
ncbi:Lp29 family lipoprotein [Leptospira wolffii]|uniref:Lp29 family lipoprotein n=2 Tax=Leptospira wolffii TaxID=409998 RepID=UPI0014382D2E|nr:hypothetical protein [Leptospira wolffii]